MVTRVLIFGLIVAAFAAWYFQWVGVEDEVSSFTYTTSIVEEGPLLESVTATGTLQALVTVQVGSEVSGRIEELFVDFNDVVKSGQPVARLGRQSYEARLAEAQAALEMARANVGMKRAELQRARSELEDARANILVLEARRDGAQARLESAEADLKRKEDLASRGLVPADQLEEVQVLHSVALAAFREANALLGAGDIRISAAKSNVARQEADLENGEANIPQRKARLDFAQVELNRTIVRAPIDGIVIERNVSKGQTVAASLEAPTLFTIAQDLSKMELIAWVDETDVGRIKPSQPATFSVDAYPERVFSGVVAQVRKSPKVIQNVVTYPVVIRTVNEDRSLLPGMTATIQVVVLETEPLLKVPLAALDFTPSKIDLSAINQSTNSTAVWVPGEDGSLRQVPIVLGQRDRSHASVLEGSLTEGTKVVTGEIVQTSRQALFGIKLGF